MATLPVSIGPVRFRPALLAAPLLLLLLVPAASATDPYARVGSRSLAPGVAHEVWRVGVSTGLVHVATVAPAARARVAVVHAAGGVANGRETPSAICRRTRGCVAAVNGDFFTADGPVGGLVVGGTMLRSPIPSHEQLSVAPLRVTAPGFDWTGTVTADGQDLRLTGLNVPLPPSGLVLYTPAYGDRTPACTCTELVLVGPDAGAAGRLGATLGLSAGETAAGGTALTAQVVLAGAGDAGERLRAIAPRAAVSLRVDTAEPTASNLGAHPLLLRDGRVARYDESDPMLSTPQPRTAVGWDARGRVWLVTADGRQPKGPGLTAAETVRLLRRLGAETAVLEDGGGSTTFVAQGRVANRPSDGTERAVVNALLVVVEAAPAAVRRVVPLPRAPLAGTMRGKKVVPAPVVTIPAPPRRQAAPPGRRAVPPPAATAVAARPVVPPQVVPVANEPVPAATAPLPAPDRSAPDLPTPAATALLLLVAAAWSHARLAHRPPRTASQLVVGEPSPVDVS